MMGDEIEIVNDDEGAIVAGERSAVERFLVHNGLLTSAHEFSLSKLTPLLQAGSGIAQNGRRSRRAVRAVPTPHA
jgi:hypothetical protein